MVNEPKKEFKVNSRPIITLLIGLTFFTVILAITLLETSKESKRPIKQVQGDLVEEGQSPGEISADKAYDKEILAVVKGMDPIKQELTLFDIETNEERILNYTGSSDIRDKYDQVISASQLTIGAMVDAGYISQSNKLMVLKTSTSSWEYIGSTNFSIDTNEKTITIGKTKYKFTDDLVVINDGAFVTVNDLAKQDELMIRGFDQTIWSIEVTRGHGTVKLIDVKAFSEGMITIGYEAIQQVSEDLTVVVREGNFNLMVENGAYSAIKNITVNRNQETVVSLGDLGPNGVKRGYITFDINPFGADLLLGGVLTFYGNPVELLYGEHTMEVTLGGYTTYQGILEVDSASKRIQVNLPEKSSNEPVDIIVAEEETDSGSEYNDWEITDDVNDSEEQENASDNEEASEEDYIIDEEHAIYIQNPAGASVYLNGDYLGISPGSFAKVIGKHIFTFIREGYETKSYTIEVLNDNQDAYISMPNLIRKQ